MPDIDTMPGALKSSGAPAKPKASSKPTANTKRLVLCFDGTGNTFQGNPSDTNIVKLLNMFDHTAKDQDHYYQPGIGTYTADGSVNRSWLGQKRADISQTIDSGLATSFDQHVIAGYRFLMRYYNKGDFIYVFGFSRGAFTARYLSRMVRDLGLLAAGNEEMVPFAYKVFQDAFMEQEPGVDLLKEDPRETAKAAKYLVTFRRAFCTRSQDDSAGVKVHFLGLFDTVSSVGTFDVGKKNSKGLPAINGTAQHVRHAVAIDERRVKFKPDLLLATKSKENVVGDDETIKEVWFPGNHGDVGGGWAPETPEIKKQRRDQRVLYGEPRLSEANTRPSNDPYQPSDIALKWMVDELDDVFESGGTPESEGIFEPNGISESDGISNPKPKQLKWNIISKGKYLKNYATKHGEAIISRTHDTMAFGGGSSMMKALMWKFMEFLPFIKRWEYTGYAEKREDRQPDTKKDGLYGWFTSLFENKNKVVGDWGEWNYYALPTNAGSTRDIPHGATFHAAVIQRFIKFPHYGEKRNGDGIAWQPNNDCFPEEPKQGPLDKSLNQNLNKNQNKSQDQSHNKSKRYLWDAANHLNQALRNSGSHKAGPVFKFDRDNTIGGGKRDVGDHLFKLEYGTYSNEDLKIMRELRARIPKDEIKQ